MVVISMSELSKNIIKFRKAKGMTQAELAEKLYISAQAISKWEKGGSPDALILPELASALDVSIDELFGIEKKNNVYAEIAKAMQENKDNEFDIAFKIGWQAVLLLTGSDEVKQLLNKIDLDLDPILKNDNLARIESKSGFSIANITKNKQFLMLLKKSDDGYADMLGDKKTSAQFFQLLANEDVLEVIFYFISQPSGKYISFSQIQKQTKISSAKLVKILNDLVKYKVFIQESILNDTSEENIYMIYKDKFVFAILVLAKNIYENDSMLVNLDLSNSTNS